MNWQSIKALSFLGGAFFASSVLAADIKPNNVGPLDDADFSARWEGNYIGVNIGAASAGTNIDRGAGNQDLTFVEGRLNVGINAGFNRQLGSGNWIWGGKIELSTLRTNVTKNDSVVGQVNLESNAVGEALLRAGYGWDRVHLYGTAGLAVSDIQTFGATKDKNSYRAGIAYGVGAEYAWNEDWSTSIEAVQYNFGDAEIDLNGTKRKVDLGAGVIRLGISRKF